jgi:hypothetical protein
LLHPRLAFVRQRRDLCYQCRLSLNLDFNIWNGLRRKKRLDEDIDWPDLGRLGPTCAVFGAARLMIGRTRPSLVSKSSETMDTILQRMQGEGLHIEVIVCTDPPRSSTSLYIPGIRQARNVSYCKNHHSVYTSQTLNKSTIISFTGHLNAQCNPCSPP